MAGSFKELLNLAKSGLSGLLRATPEVAEIATEKTVSKGLPGIFDIITKGGTKLAENAFGPPSFIKNETAKRIFSGGIRRTIGGAVIGGVIGAATEEDNSSNAKFGAFMGGALIGAGIGGATATIWRDIAKKYGGRFGKQLVNKLGSASWSGIKKLPGALGSGAVRAANFAAKHPGIATTGVVAGLMAIGTPGVKTRMVENMIDPEDTDRRRSSRANFAGSADGLAFGLHNRRHT